MLAQMVDINRWIRPPGSLNPRYMSFLLHPHNPPPRSQPILHLSSPMLHNLPKLRPMLNRNKFSLKLGISSQYSSRSSDNTFASVNNDNKRYSSNSSSCSINNTRWPISNNNSINKRIDHQRQWLKLDRRTLRTRSLEVHNPLLRS